MTILVETLDPAGGRSVIALDGQPVEWGTLRKIDSSRVLLGSVHAIVNRAVAQAAPVEQVVVRRGNTSRVLARPMIGPSGRVFAVDVWVGDPEDAPAAAGEIAAIEWSSQSRLIEVNAQPRGLADAYPIRGRMTLTAPEALRYLTKLQDAVDLISRALNPEPDMTWTGTATIEAGDDKLRSVHLVMRTLPAPDEYKWVGILHDVTKAVEPDEPSLEAAAIAALTSRDDSMAVVLMDVDQARLLTWLTDPIPGIQWKGTVDNRDTPPDEDVRRIFATFKEMGEGEPRSEVTSVRLRRIDGGWTTVDSRVTLIPRREGPSILLVEMTPTDVQMGETDEVVH